MINAKIDWKVNCTIVVGFRRSRYQTLYFFQHSRCNSECRSKRFQCL